MEVLGFSSKKNKELIWWKQRENSKTVGEAEINPSGPLSSAILPRKKRYILFRMQWPPSYVSRDQERVVAKPSWKITAMQKHLGFLRSVSCGKDVIPNIHQLIPFLIENFIYTALYRITSLKNKETFCSSSKRIRNLNEELSSLLFA